MSLDETTIAVMGERIEATHDERPIDDLFFLPDNPRVYAAIRGVDGFDELTVEEQQDRIYRQLLEEPSVKELLPEIRRDGGLQDPIIVRYDRWQVVEGNSRLAVYRKLKEESGHDRWSQIPCRLVSGLTDDQQTRILGQAHLKGRTDWSRYSRALFCYRKVREKGKTPQELSALAGMSVRAVNNDVEIVQLMHDNGDDKHSRFSYYEVLVKTRAISKGIREDATLKAHLLTQIKEGRDFTAQEMRDWLPTVMKKPKILRKLVRAEIGLDEAFDRAKVSRTKDRLKRVLEQLRDIERSEVALLTTGEVNAITGDARRVAKEAARVAEMVTAESDRRKKRAGTGS